MDPQQRLLLDVFAEALAGDTTTAHPTATAQLGSSHVSFGAQAPDMGVYVGVSQLEYARMTLEAKTDLNAYYATGGWGCYATCYAT